MDTAVQPHQSAKAVVHTAAYDVTFRHTGNMRLLDALIRRKLPVCRDAPDADAPDAYYPYPDIEASSLHLQHRYDTILSITLNLCGCKCEYHAGWIFTLT